MQAEEIRSVDLTTDAGYDSQWTLMRDLFVWLDLRLYYFYSHHQWLGPSSEMKNMLDLVVTREEFEHQLAKSAQMGLEEELSEEERTQLEEPQRAIALRLGRTAQTDIPLLRLFERCGLDAFEQNCVILAYAAVLDRKYEKLLAYLQDDMTRKAPGTALAVQLFLPRGGNMEQYLARFTQRGRFARLFRRDALERGELILHPLALEYLSSGTIENRPGLTVFDGTARRPDGPLIVQGEIAQFVHHLPVAGRMELRAVQLVLAVQARHPGRLLAGQPDLLWRKMELGRQFFGGHIVRERLVTQESAEQFQPFAFG